MEEEWVENSMLTRPWGFPIHQVQLIGMARPVVTLEWARWA